MTKPARAKMQKVTRKVRAKTLRPPGLSLFAVLQLDARAMLLRELEAGAVEAVQLWMDHEGRHLPAEQAESLLHRLDQQQTSRLDALLRNEPAQ